VLTAEATAERKAAQLDELLSKQERDSNVLNDAVRTLELRFNSLKSDSTAASSAAAGSMETEARQLCAELRDVLDENHLALIDDGIEPASAQATRPLSRMRKAELVAECAGARAAACARGCVRTRARASPLCSPRSRTRIPR
jgi:hypothetical protein